MSAAATDTGLERIAAAFAGAAGRAALMPYLMGGFPDVEASVADRRGLRGRRRRPRRARRAVLGPARRRPGHPRRRHARAARRARRCTACSRSARGSRERLPVVLMCYANPMLARGVERFADELAGAGISGLIVPDLPLEEARRGARGVRRRRARARAAVAPTTPDDRLAAIGGQRARLPLHGLGHRDDRRARRRRRRAGAVLARAKAAQPASPWRVGFGISTPEQARRRRRRRRRRRDRRLAARARRRRGRRRGRGSRRRGRRAWSRRSPPGSQR